MPLTGLNVVPPSVLLSIGTFGIQTSSASFGFTVIVE
jgi:hypothetical protein